MVNGTDKDSEIHDKAMREIKTKRLLHEMEFHTSMQITTSITVMRVTGGWIYFNWQGSGICGVFVPERS